MRITIKQQNGAEEADGQINKNKENEIWKEECEIDEEQKEGRIRRRTRQREQEGLVKKTERAEDRETERVRKWRQRMWG